MGIKVSQWTGLSAKKRSTDWEVDMMDIPKNNLKLVIPA